MARATSCGVVITDGTHILLGHAARSPRWDIPKGLAETGETQAEAAARELKEETGLNVDAAELTPLGIHRYMPAKDLALFLWRPAAMPAPDTLVCASTFIIDGIQVAEFDRFGIFAWDDVLARVGKNMARVLAEVRQSVA